jgi:hypothetical protein
VGENAPIDTEADSIGKNPLRQVLAAAQKDMCDIALRLKHWPHQRWEVLVDFDHLLKLVQNQNYTACRSCATVCGNSRSFSSRSSASFRWSETANSTPHVPLGLTVSLGRTGKDVKISPAWCFSFSNGATAVLYSAVANSLARSVRVATLNRSM